MAGRPSGQMTTRRQQVLSAFVSASENGTIPTAASIARACNLCDRREASRIIKDLRQLGKLN